MDPRKWFDTSIRRKFVVLYALIALPTLFVGILTFNQANHMVRRQLEIGVDNELSSLCKNMLNKADYYEYTVNQAVINEKFIYILTNEYENLLNLALDLQNYLNPYFTTVRYLNRSINNISIYHENYMPEYGTYVVNASRIRDAEWYQKSLTSLECQWYFRDDALYLMRMFPPFLMGGETAVLVFEFNRDILLREIIGSYSSSYGIVIYNEQQSPIYEDPLAGIGYTAGELYENPEGLPGIIARSADLEELGLHITVYTWNRTVATALGIFSITAVLILLTITLIILSLWIFDKSMIKPLVALDRSIREVGRGNYTGMMGISGNDEIGRICQQFDHMVRQVEQLISQVTAANTEKTRAELTALRTQINPHFLYNSLSAITWKAVFSDNREIHDIATSLATFYRTVLNRGNTLIEVENEIKNIEAYVKIQRILRDNCFDVVWNIQPEALQHEVLCFILQPLVENAIVHGIDRKTGGKGLLSISAYIESDHIWFHVEDNGDGLDEQAMNKSPFDGKGYGIRNVNERIRLYYGEGYRVTYAGRQPQGVIATIRLPIKSEVT